MHDEILSENQKKLLPFLKAFNRKFYLVGGTAISLYLGHRRSIDFDLFCENGFSKTYVYSKLKPVPFKINKLMEDVDQVHFVVNEIKLTFFHFPYPIVHKNRFNEYISIPELKTLAAMKAFALGRRAKWKDYVDLFYLLKYHYTIEEVSDEAIKCFGDLFSERLFRQQLAFHSDINYSEPIEFLVPAPSENEIKQFLIDKALDILT
jgi:hypothetical protein